MHSLPLPFGTAGLDRASGALAVRATRPNRSVRPRG